MAVMFCGWEVKADMDCLQVKLCVAICEHFRLKALYKNVQVYFLLYEIVTDRQTDRQTEGQTDGYRDIAYTARRY